jgi:hypothetical protein
MSANSPVHLASGLPVLLVRGLHKSTKLTISNSHILDFKSLHALVSSWYFYMFATTLSLFDSSRSFSSDSLGHARASIVVHKLRCFTSSGSTTSAPYISWDGVKFVPLHTVVLWLHTTFGTTSTHLPSFSPSSIFLLLQILRCWPFSLCHSTGDDTPR